MTAYENLVITKVKELREELESLENHPDPEAAHCSADSAMCKFFEEINHPEVVVAFNNIEKWYA